MIRDKEECMSFLKDHGWYEMDELADDYRHFIKEDDWAIDIGDDEIVFIDDTGDWLHILLNRYALIGALVEHRALPYNF